MLMHHTDFDNHLDCLENKTGNIFYYTRRVGTNPFVSHVVRTVMETDSLHSVLFVEDRGPKDYRRICLMLERIGNEVEKRKEHLIHAFILHPDLFKMVQDYDASTQETPNAQT